MDAPVGVVKAYLELCGYFVLSELPLRLPDKHGYRDLPTSTSSPSVSLTLRGQYHGARGSAGNAGNAEVRACR